MHNQLEELTKVLNKATSAPKLTDELSSEELSRYTLLRLDNMFLIQSLINGVLNDIDTDEFVNESVLQTLSVLNALAKEYK